MTLRKQLSKAVRMEYAEHGFIKRQAGSKTHWLEFSYRISDKTEGPVGICKGGRIWTLTFYWLYRISETAQVRFWLAFFQR